MMRQLILGYRKVLMSVGGFNKLLYIERENKKKLHSVFRKLCCSGRFSSKKSLTGTVWCLKLQKERIIAIIKMSSHRFPWPWVDFLFPSNLTNDQGYR